MNAYELADELENLFNRFLHPHSKFQDFLNAATMLRQQAERIAELEGEVSSLKHINKNWQLSETMAYNRIAELEKEKVTPGQFICPSCGCKSLFKTDKSEWCMEYKCLWQSDYPVKQLSDEEILKLTPFHKHPYDIFIEYEKEDLIEFARAIIKEITE